MANYVSINAVDLDNILGFLSGELNHTGNCYDGSINDNEKDDSKDLCKVCRARENIQIAYDGDVEIGIQAHEWNSIRRPHPFVPDRFQSIVVAGSGNAVCVEIDEGLTRANITLDEADVTRFVTAILSVEGKLRR